MNTYHLPLKLSGSLDTRNEIEHLRAILNDPDTTVDTVIEVRTGHPAIIAVIEHLVSEHQAVMEVVPDATPEVPPEAVAIAALPEKQTLPVVSFPAKKPALELRPCAVCGQLFPPKRSNSEICSDACRNQRTAQQAKLLRLKKANGNGHHPEPAPLALDVAVADAPMFDTAHQALRWLRENGGTEYESIQDLLMEGKLIIGERLHHKTKGWFEVYRSGNGRLEMRKVEA